ncbi:hypothetical protein EPUL_006075, partial [Erysiphe pulchra]
TLSKSNWRQVFTYLRLWLESKGLFYICLHKKVKYCSITHFHDRIPTDIEILTASVAALHVKKDDEVQKSSANKSNVMNHERSIQWEKDESALEREITSFNREVQAPGKSPEECFNRLKVLRRRYLLQKSEKKESLRNEDLFGYLLDGLTGEEWKLTKNTLDAQPNIETEDKLEILQQLWDSKPSLKLTNEEDGFVARSRWPNSRLHKQHRRNLSASPEERSWDRESKQSSRNRARGYRCYMCKSEELRVDTCQYKERAYEWALQLCLKEEKVSTRSSKSFKHSSTRKDPNKIANSRRTESNRPKVKRTAYIAQDIDSEVYGSYSSTESENETVEEEGMMAYSDETTCGKPRNSSILPTWHVDTAASSHMTDYPKNFRGPLRPTRRVIKVGG